MSAYDPNYIPEKNYVLLGVKVALVTDRQEVLLLQRSDKVSRAHGWDLPGGGVDAVEAPKDAAIREVLEETNLRVDNLQLLDTYAVHDTPDTTLILGYAAKISKQDVVLSWEHEAYQWVPLNEVATFNLPGVHQAIIQHIRQSQL